MKRRDAVGIRRHVGLVARAIALVLLALPVLAADVLEEGKISAPEFPTYLNYGYSVSISGDLMVVGNPFRPAVVGPGGYPSDGGPGAVFVYRYEAGSWVQEDKLTASDESPALSNDFGHSVSIRGETILVGAPARTSQSLGNGSAYFFRFEEGVWVEKAIFSASDEVAGQGNRFGFDVSLAPSGDMGVVGAPGTGAAAEPGAYVFRFDGSTWSEETKLESSDGLYYDDFGGAVSAHGDTVAVGARHGNNSATDAGAAYVFRYATGIWAEESKLLASDAGEDRHFGSSLAIEGETLLVGAPGPLDEQAGAAYEFRFDGMDWLEASIITPADPGTYTAFGKSLVMNDDLAVIGGRVDDGSSIPPATAFLFRDSRAGWVEEARLLASDYGGYSFGYSASLSNGRLVVGEHADGEVGSGAGSIFLFSTSQTVPVGGAAVLSALLGILGSGLLRARRR
jgi:hypothetical protein